MGFICPKKYKTKIDKIKTGKAPGKLKYRIKKY
jgi:hypothetical protein